MVYINIPLLHLIKVYIKSTAFTGCKHYNLRQLSITSYTIGHFICLFICLLFIHCLSKCLSCLSVRQSAVCLQSIRECLLLSTIPVCLCTCLPFCMITCPLVCLSVFLSVFLSVCLSFFVSASSSFSFSPSPLLSLSLFSCS